MGWTGGGANNNTPVFGVPRAGDDPLRSYARVIEPGASATSIGTMCVGPGVKSLEEMADTAKGGREGGRDKVVRGERRIRRGGNIGGNLRRWEDLWRKKLK